MPIEYALFEMPFDLTEQEPIAIFLHTLFLLLGAVILLLLFFSKDCIIGYESIGKKIMNLHIYDEDGNIVRDRKVLFKRSFYSFLHYLKYSFIFPSFDNNQTYGDKKTDTYLK